MISLTKYIPYPSVTHAGGQYLLAHDRALGSMVEIEQLAPDIPLNRQALPLVDGGPKASLLAGTHLDGLRLTLARLESVWSGSAIYWPVRRLFRGSKAPWATLRAADLIEFQWSEMIALAPLVRRRLPSTPLVGIAHDIITQRLDRQAEGPGAGASSGKAVGSGSGPGSGPSALLKRALIRLAAARSRKREAQSFRALDLLIAFSEKDVALARELSPGTRVEVVHPGLGPTDALPRSPNEIEPQVLFTGAMNRPENWQAVMWFIDAMWPTVLAQVPAARLIIAGADPPQPLADKVAATPRATLTGFVESLEPFYAEASVFIAPLRSGAGVKFKTIDAMLRGVPIVTTSVGAEGIDAPDLFAAVTDDAATFADAVVTQLQHPDDAGVRQAQQWADGVYGTRAFEDRLRGLYRELIEGAAQ